MEVKVEMTLEGGEVNTRVHVISIRPGLMTLS